MSATQVIANYESLAALTEQMHDAALRGEWDPLVTIEEQRGKLIAAMKPLDAEVQLDEAARLRKDELIVQILAGDEEVRKLAETWMSQLQLSMQSNRQEQLLLNTYGA